MRNEKEMMNLILNTARKDERIRAVYMNGSRTNPNVPKDIFMDYDIVYVVNETASFIQDDGWIKIFGDLLILQEPDKLDKFCQKDVNYDDFYGYLMLFTDGNRIDLHIQSKQAMLNEYKNDKLTIPLLDKDNCLPIIPSPTDVDYHIKPPTKGFFDCCTNDFWWCLQNVAKGIWREELPYAKNMYEITVSEKLYIMISWWIGMQYDYNISAGKMGKYFKKYLPDKYWELYIKTYADSSYENMWSAIFSSCDLFRILAIEVAKHFEYSYNYNDDKNMTFYLKQVQQLPKNAESII